MTTLCPLPTISASFSTSRLRLSRLAEGRLEPGQHVGIAAGLPQPGEQGEKSERFLAHRRPHVIAQPFQPLGANPGVFGALDVGHGADEIHLDLGRQLLRHFAFCPAKDEGCQLGSQARQGALAVRSERRLERSARTQEPGQQEAENAPQVELPILQRGPGQNEPMPGPDGETGLRDFRVGILDELALVQDRVAEFGLIQERPVLAQLGVAAQPDDRIAPAGEIAARS